MNSAPAQAPAPAAATEAPQPPRTLRAWRPWRRINMGPAMRIAWGLVSLTLGLVLLVEFFVGFPPDRHLAAQRQREHTSAEAAWRVAMAIDGQGGEVAAVPRVLREALPRAPDLRSMQLLSRDGQVLATAGDHQRHWVIGRGDRSTVNNVRVPLHLRGERWGELQVSYASVWPSNLAGWLRDPSLQRLLLLTLLGTTAFWLYLRRMLRHLDPNAAVPERVRDAFNTLTEGVLVLDTQAQVVLANDAFCELHGQDARQLTGQPVARLELLRHALQDRKPWVQVMSKRNAVSGLSLSLLSPHMGPRELVLNCAPILDGRRLRGCLLSFSDVTELHERTERLRVALDELHLSQEEVQRKNEELRQLANHDALTGINNRRALMDQARAAFAQAQASGQPLSCIMCDIDHFKSVNDRFGHGGGDQVIQCAARLLKAGLQPIDILGRYGGEEFCVILPGSTSEATAAAADAIRAELEVHLGAALTEFPGQRVTMSFGVAQIKTEGDHLDALIDRADQALYHAKKTGRNQVSIWPVPAVE